MADDPQDALSRRAAAIYDAVLAHHYTPFSWFENVPGSEEAARRNHRLAGLHSISLELASDPVVPATSAPLESSGEQQKLRDLADRIDYEKLWMRPVFERLDGSMTPAQIDRLDAGVALRRYAELLSPGRWLVFPPRGGVQFSASTLAAAAGMAQRDEERRANPSPGQGGS